ncbi:UNVERIFIED_CONTAM: hypothetical protein NCL1_06598 [Trichonephila clavipes]
MALPSGHRYPGPRHPVGHPLRLAHFHPDRPRLGVLRPGGGHRHRAGGGLLRRADRKPADALWRHPAVDPHHPDRHSGQRHRARTAAPLAARGGRGRRAGAGHRAVGLGAICPHRAGADSRRTRQGICAGGATAQGARAAHHVPPHPAQYAHPDPRCRHAELRHGDPDRSHAVLPRHRDARQPAQPRHADPAGQSVPVLRHVVDHRLPRAATLPAGRRRQHPRGLAAGRPEPETEVSHARSADPQHPPDGGRSAGHPDPRGPHRRHRQGPRRRRRNGRGWRGRHRHPDAGRHPYPSRQDHLGHALVSGPQGRQPSGSDRQRKEQPHSAGPRCPPPVDASRHPACRKRHRPYSQPCRHRH